MMPADVVGAGPRRGRPRHVGSGLVWTQPQRFHRGRGSGSTRVKTADPRAGYGPPPPVTLPLASAHNAAVAVLRLTELDTLKRSVNVRGDDLLGMPSWTIYPPPEASTAGWVGRAQGCGFPLRGCSQPKRWHFLKRAEQPTSTFRDGDWVNGNLICHRCWTSPASQTAPTKKARAHVCTIGGNSTCT